MRLASTRRAYQTDFARLSQWCGERHVSALAAVPSRPRHLLLGFSGAFRRFGRPTNLALIGQYAAAEFVTEAPDPGGGIAVAYEPAPPGSGSTQALLAKPHH